MSSQADYVLTTFEGVHMRRFAVFCRFGKFDVDFRSENPVGKSVPELAVSRHIWKEILNETRFICVRATAAMTTFNNAIAACTTQAVADQIAQVMSEVSAKTGSGMTYTGSPIQLINTPTTALPEGYTMKYAVTTENAAPTDDNLYTTSIPTATDAGTYYVWYKVVGDTNHTDTAAECAVTLIVPVFGPATFTLPAGVRTIEANAFEGAAMTVVDIPEGCTSIGANAFKNCANLTQIRIPASVTRIDATAFEGCEKVLVYGTINSTAQIFCADHANCAFVAEN